jgi:hypothetical protein
MGSASWEEFVNMVRQFYANLDAKCRSNRKTFELTSMVNKKSITITSQEVALFLILMLVSFASAWIVTSNKMMSRVLSHEDL